MTASRSKFTAGPGASGEAPEPRPLFEDVFLGGFECSCQVLRTGQRLDMCKATRHDDLALPDYARLRAMGITACRDGASWVAAVRPGGELDFSGVLPLLRAAEHQRIQVIWDLMHFGWPDGVDVFSPSFPARFARYAGSFARFIAAETDVPPFVAPINEMSFLAWAGGDVRFMNPFQAARGVELKAQLVRATIEAIEAVRAVSPRARFLCPEPVIHIVPRDEHPKTWARVESDNLLQYQAWQMLSGEVWPSLGGDPKYLDVIGVNFYSDNQFMLDGTTIHRDDPRYRRFSTILCDVWSRFGRPMIVSETGSEGEARAPWLRYVADECLIALGSGCELHGVTLYPVVNHPGWLDDRHCHNGLWDYADEAGHRPLYEPLAQEILRQRPRLEAARRAMLRARAGACGELARSREAR